MRLGVERDPCGAVGGAREWDRIGDCLCPGGSRDVLSRIEKQWTDVDDRARWRIWCKFCVNVSIRRDACEKDLEMVADVYAAKCIQCCCCCCCRLRCTKHILVRSEKSFNSVSTTFNARTSLRAQSHSLLETLK